MKTILMTQTVVYPTHGVRALQYNEGREVTVPDDMADVFLNNGQATLVRVEVPAAPVVEVPEEKAVPAAPENKAVGAEETKAPEIKPEEMAAHDSAQLAAPADPAHEAQTT